MSALPTNLPDRFYIDLAIGTQSFAEICRLYQLNPDEVEEHTEDPLFIQRLAQAEQAVADDGRAFRARCKRVVHDSIPRMQALINRPDVPAATQLSAFQTLVRYSGMEPEKQAKPTHSGPALTFTIIGPGQQRMETRIEGTVVDNEDDEDDDFIPLASPEESRMFSV